MVKVWHVLLGNLNASDPLHLPEMVRMVYLNNYENLERECEVLRQERDSAYEHGKRIADSEKELREALKAQTIVIDNLMANKELTFPRWAGIHLGEVQKLAQAALAKADGRA